jgi:O-antigen/teichoic acid export membrane protein
MSVGVTLLSKTLNEKEFKTRSNGFSFVLLSTLITTIPICCFIYFLSDYIIKFTFGSSYIQSSEIVFLISVSCGLGVIGFMNNRMINSLDGGSSYLLKKVVTMSIFSLIVGVYCIKIYGLNGAAYSLLLSEFMSLTVANYFFKNGLFLKVHFNMFRSLSYYRNYYS